MTDKLKIGLLDFLAILLPGGLFILVVGVNIAGIANDKSRMGFDLVEGWISATLFLVLAYVLGHFFFSLASFLDQIVYEKIKRLYWHDFIKLTAYVIMLRAKKTGVNDGDVINAFKWSCTWLNAREPAVYGEVERYMAESKFFRSMVIVSLILLSYYIWNGHNWEKILIVAVLMIFSVGRYLSRRHKSIEAAYHGMITTAGEVFPPEPDATILADLNNKLLFPFKNLYNRIQEKNKKEVRGIRLDKPWYDILKLLYATAICIVPFFNPGSSPRKQ